MRPPLTVHWNVDPKPFVWHAESDKIIEKVRRKCKTLTQVKAATDTSCSRCDGSARLQAVEDRERAVDPCMVASCVVVEHQATDDGERQGGLGLGGDVVGARRSQQLGELGEPVVDTGTAETREPVGLGLSEGVDLVEESEEGTVGRVRDDYTKGADEAA